MLLRPSRVHATVVLTLIILSATGWSTATAIDGSASGGIVFPVEAPVDSYADTWGAPRGGGRTHEGTDILAPQMREVYAAAAGEIIKADGEDCPAGLPCESYYLAVAGDDGRGYFYVHLNNDTPGRPNGCDGTGGVANAFAPRLVEQLESSGSLSGVRVERGELLGWVGSSGNAACGVDQLHFEIWRDHDWGSTGKLNPYPELVAAETADAQPPADGSPPSRSLQRDAGGDRIGTAIALSRATWEQSHSVVLAPADSPVPALLAGPLAAVLDAPLLLVPPDGEPPSSIAEEVGRLGARAAVVVGDVDFATIDGIVAESRLEPGQVQRISATSDAELSVAVARTIIAAGGQQDQLVVAATDEEAVDGGPWPDALMASLLAGHRGGPVLLTHGLRLSPAVEAAVEEWAPSRIEVVGGRSVVSADATTSLATSGARVHRLAGPERMSTALAVADAVLADRDSQDIPLLHVATARNYPDALAAAPAILQQAGMLVLIDTPDASRHVLDWVADRRPPEIHAIGGPSAVSPTAAEAVATVLPPNPE